MSMNSQPNFLDNMFESVCRCFTPEVAKRLLEVRADEANKLIEGTSHTLKIPIQVACELAKDMKESLLKGSHSAEGNEYRAYIEYLQSLGYFTGAVEDVELDELQGVHGLRALRVTVDLSNPRIDRRITPGDLQPATPDASRN